MSWRTIYTCPDCETDLEEDEHGLWCSSCETLFSYAQLADDTDQEGDQR